MRAISGGRNHNVGPAEIRAQAAFRSGRRSRGFPGSPQAVTEYRGRFLLRAGLFERNEFVKAAKRRGFNVEPSKRTPLHWYKRELYVNGKFCLLRRAYKNVGRKGWYTAIRKPGQRAEICVLELGKGRFLIIPMKNMPRSATMFSLDDTDSSKRVYKLRYNWREYLNNWAAFNQKRGRRVRFREKA